ncbi:MAG: 2-amino-4-hydroxy-6-hydroxymethyldihydropteridine diphosphokinase [Phycisphaerae bacterium]|nr:2-amino-4-hydroxy-6-hydroxymethyldihydropteridine diphosphokinase [Phycisphaerae bacterium]
MPHAFIGIGTNVGDRHAMIELAKEHLSQLDGSRPARFSGVYETDPVGPIAQGAFLNAAAELDTPLEPLDLLEALRAIEGYAGRKPADRRVRWGPRCLDLDIILYGDSIISTDQLVIPHPMMHERWFVLKPIADLDAGAVHPLLQMTVGELLQYIEQGGNIKSPNGDDVT